MRALLFGASGRVGRQVLIQAAAAGLAVTGFGRRPVGTRPWIQGDVLDEAAVARAVPGHEIIISAIGNPAGNPHGDRTVSRGTKNILSAMERSGASRLISVSGFGAGESWAQASWLFRALLATRLRDVYKDKALQEEAIRASAVDWLILRPAKLLDAAPGRRLREIEGRGHLYERIPVDEVARFIVSELRTPRRHRVAVSLGSERLRPE